MPEEGMYHCSDPQSEADTHQIRKQFYETIREIEQQGQSIYNVEAFLVNTNDMDKIHRLFRGTSDVPGGPSDGQMKMYGIKIIESEYVPEGTIFKVFKNDSPEIGIPGAITGHLPMGQAGSGVIPNWGHSPELFGDVVTTTSTDVDDITTEDIKKNMEKAIEAVNKVIDEPIPQGHVPPKEKRHSTKRRIELDE